MHVLVLGTGPSAEAVRRIAGEIGVEIAERLTDRVTHVAAGVTLRDRFAASGSESNELAIDRLDLLGCLGGSNSTAFITNCYSKFAVRYEGLGASL
jgi:hypothetical protein